jgi:hypothetical protein
LFDEGLSGFGSLEGGMVPQILKHVLGDEKYGITSSTFAPAHSVQHIEITLTF